MIFDNTIAVGDIISIIAIFVTFRTIVQVKHQRKDANRPYVVIDFINEFDEQFSIKERNFDELYDVETTFFNKLYIVDKNPFDFKIKNIGNGIARDVKITIKVENIELVRLDKSMYIQDNLLIMNYPEHIKKGYLNRKFLDSWELYFAYLGCDSEFSIENSLNRFSDIICTIIYHYMSNDDRDAIGKRLIPNICIELEYKNILNNKYKDVFQVEVHPGMWGSFETLFSIKLINKKKKIFKFK